MKRKLQNKFSKKIVAGVIVLNIVFTAAVLYVFLKTGSEPITLTGCWFGFTTGELWMVASIKKTKVKKITNEQEEQNNVCD